MRSAGHTTFDGATGLTPFLPLNYRRGFKKATSQGLVANRSVPWWVSISDLRQRLCARGSAQLLAPDSPLLGLWGAESLVRVLLLPQAVPRAPVCRALQCPCVPPGHGRASARGMWVEVTVSAGYNRSHTSPSGSRDKDVPVWAPPPAWAPECGVGCTATRERGTHRCRVVRR